MLANPTFRFILGFSMIVLSFEGAKSLAGKAIAAAKDLWVWKQQQDADRAAA